MKLDSSISAVITGGASGLGAATARLLASHGVKVGLFDLNEELGEKLARELGGVFCKVDITSETYECARRYMIRLERQDFDEPQVSKLAAVVNLTPGQFRQRFAAARPIGSTP